MRTKRQFIMTLSLNLFVCWVKICKLCACVFVITDFRCDLPNDGKQKQVKSNEVHLLWIFCKYYNLSNNGKQKQVKSTEVYLTWIFCKYTFFKLLVINTEGKLQDNFLTRHLNLSRCNNSTPKWILACVDACNIHWQACSQHC